MLEDANRGDLFQTNPVDRAARLLYRMRSNFLGGLQVEPAPVLVT
jgi:hypothetical protein